MGFGRLLHCAAMAFQMTSHFFCRMQSALPKLAGGQCWELDMQGCTCSGDEDAEDNTTTLETFAFGVGANCP